MVINLISRKGYKMSDQPFQKSAFWPIISKFFWKCVPPELKAQTLGNFSGKELRRYSIMNIVDEGGPDVEIKLRTIGECYLAC
jgi:hypothetical protein